MIISEKLLLVHPEMIKYYHLRYKIYELLNLDFDLFFTEDIYNYNDGFYGLTKQKYDVHTYYDNYKFSIPEISKDKTLDLSKYVVRSKITTNTNEKTVCVDTNLYINDISNVLWILYPYDLRILDTIFSKIPFNQQQLDTINLMNKILLESRGDYTLLIDITGIINSINKNNLTLYDNNLL